MIRNIDFSSKDVITRMLLDVLSDSEKLMIVARDAAEFYDRMASATTLNVKFTVSGLREVVRRTDLSLVTEFIAYLESNDLVLFDDDMTYVYFQHSSAHVRDCVVALIILAGWQFEQSQTLK